ncbi:proline rich protein [Mycobacterium tuberculosis]|nr:proline rich protein [Mycobacterium tuberculosis]
MATGARPALGLSIGVTNLAAVAADHSITRKPVLTLYRQRPPEVGVPSENPRLDEPGLVITDFVDRVGDSVGIVAADGSVYRSEALVADALLALAYTATGGRALPGSVTVTYPAHWGPAAVAALDSALRRASEWSHGTSSTAQPLSLLPDAAAALYAIRADPGIPARGIVAVCDFGGSGTGITLVDAADEYRPVAATVRHQAFSGDLIDQSLLSYVMSELPGTGAFDPAGTSAIGSLTKLRIECRKAKERLSSSTVTTLTDALGGDIRLTRNELEDTIRDSLDSVGRALEQTLARSGIRTAELVAIVSVGGGANIPAVTTTLSGRFCVPVVRTPRPQLTAAFGGALWAARRPGDTSATVLTAGAIERATVGLRGGGCIQRGQDPLFDLLPEERCETPGRLVQAFHQRRLVAAMGRSRDLQVGLGQARMRGIGDDAPAGRAAAAVQLAGEHQDRQLRLAIGRHRGVRPLEL